MPSRAQILCSNRNTNPNLTTSLAQRDAKLRNRNEINKLIDECKQIALLKNIKFNEIKDDNGNLICIEFALAANQSVSLPCYPLETIDNISIIQQRHCKSVINSFDL